MLALALAWEAPHPQAAPPAQLRLLQLARPLVNPALDNPGLVRLQLACLARQLGRLSGKRVWGNPA